MFGQSPSDEEVLKKVEVYQPVTNIKLAKEMRIDDKTARRRLDKLAEEGKLERKPFDGHHTKFQYELP